MFFFHLSFVLLKKNMPELHRLSSITGNPDADCDIDLGAERSSSVIDSPIADNVASDKKSTSDELDTWTMSGIAPTTNLPEKPRDWHSKSYSEKQKEQSDTKPKQEDYRDCGICFEFARDSRRTPCCRSLFCFEHISDWLNRPSSDGKCPSCSTPCTIASNGKIVLSEAPHPPAENAHSSSYAPSSLSSPYLGPHESTVNVDPIGED
ncbi:hypothetical protein C8R42DRAFT_662765 [Lentinula raphanica]|nr:hypothetical protein C8R42DRAFT_662765 [Lentinula raphanica]